MEASYTKKWIFKISLLSISLMTMIAPAVSPALPLMYRAFPGYSNSAVETLLTVPNFGIMICLFLSPLIISFIGEKKTVVIGLVLALAAGIFPMFSNDYALVFASRFLFGAGVGLFNSLTISLIARFYKGDALSSMMGFQSASGSLGAASVAFLVSYLVTLGWHQTFLIYAIALPILLLFTLFVPLENDHKGGKAKNIKNKEHLPHQKNKFQNSSAGFVDIYFICLLFGFAI